MKDLKLLYSSIILIFTIYVFVEFFSGLLSVLIVISGINGYIILAGQLFLYIAIIYFVFYKLKTVPDFKLWFIILVFSLFITPKNFFYNYTIDELIKFGDIMDYKKAGGIIFKFVFALFACIKYYRIKKIIEQ